MRPLLPLIALVMLAGCSTAPERSLPDDHRLAWQERQQYLSQLNHWDLNGRLAILTDHEGWHVTINWEQRAEDYAIMLIAPLGQGSLKLEGNASMVIMQGDEGEVLTADDPGKLLEQRFGWRVPVAALRYWVRGMPAPGKHKAKLDEHGRLIQLTQNEWDIQLLDYREQQGTELPGRVFASNHQGKVKLVISNWQLQTEQ